MKNNLGTDLANKSYLLYEEKSKIHGKQGLQIK